MTETEDYIFGTKGTAKVLANTITGANPWKLESGDKPSMYDEEHRETVRRHQRWTHHQQWQIHELQYADGYHGSRSLLLGSTHRVGQADGFQDGPDATQL